LANPVQHLHQGAKDWAGLRPVVALAIDPEEGLPAQGLNGGKDPMGIETPIGQDNDGPVGRDTALHMPKEGFPMRAPSARARRLDAAPGHRDGTPADDDTDQEQRKALA
jgi:hypothetical protein